MSGNPPDAETVLDTHRPIAALRSLAVLVTVLTAGKAWDIGPHEEGVANIHLCPRILSVSARLADRHLNAFVNRNAQLALRWL